MNSRLNFRAGWLYEEWRQRRKGANVIMNLDNKMGNFSRARKILEKGV
jgi:hypothetical protein